MRQRLAMLAALVLAGLACLQAAPAAQAADGTAGVTLLGAGSTLGAVGAVIGWSLPALLLAAAAGAMGNPLGMVFVLGGALVFPAVAGGTIDEWLRQAGSAGAYWSLAAESLLWGVLLAVWIVVGYRLAALVRRWLPDAWIGPDVWRRRLPAHLQSDEHPVFWGFVPPEDAGALALRPLREALGPRQAALVHTFGSGAVAVVIGGLLAGLLVPYVAVWQGVWGLVLAFGLAGLAAHQLMPAANPLGIVLSPPLVGAAWYAWAATAGAPEPTLLHGYFEGELAHGALVLPVYYASAGVAGAAIGVGWSQALIALNHVPELFEPEVPDAADSFDAGDRRSTS